MPASARAGPSRTAVPARTQAQLHDRLPEPTPTASPDLRTAWEATADANLAALTTPPPSGPQDIPEQYLILVTCRDEKRQAELLDRFRREGLQCKALLS